MQGGSPSHSPTSFVVLSRCRARRVQTTIWCINENKDLTNVFATVDNAAAQRTAQVWVDCTGLHPKHVARVRNR
eukprot:scaffold4126_cov383-Prasinococcus_capsulatus_cf.AAC.6